MSVPVELAELRDQVATFGDTPYALTVRPDGRPHAVCTRVRWDGNRLRLAAGRTTAANSTTNPAVTLLWPPVEPGGYSLIVDGTASAADDGDAVLLTPAKAVLHRSLPGAAAEDPAVHGHDCVPVLEQ